MSKVTILKSDINVIEGTSKVGKPYRLEIQKGYLHTVDPQTGETAEIPEPFEFILEKGQTPYPRGHYTFAPSAYQVDRDGRLAVAVRLLPIQADKAKA